MPAQPRVLIVGGGGIGTIAALNLEVGKLASPSMVLRSNFAAVEQKGFKIASIDHGNVGSWRPAGGILPTVPDVAENGLDPFDFIVCCTKNVPDIPPLLADIIRPAVTPGHSVIVLIQNGLNIEKPILREFPSNICLSGISLCSAEETQSGVVLHNDHDKLEIGPFPGNQNTELAIKAAHDFVNIYAASGRAKCTFIGDVQHTRWRKLLTNAVYNPVSALTNLDTSRLRLMSVDHLAYGDIIEGLLRPAMREIIRAAREVDNVTLEDHLMDAALESDQLEAFIKPSMQQDVVRGSFIEYDVILGEVLRSCKAVGLEMPYITTLYYLCRGLQFRTREARGIVNIPALVEDYKKKT